MMAGIYSLKLGGVVLNKKKGKSFGEFGFCEKVAEVFLENDIKYNVKMVNSLGHSIYSFVLNKNPLMKYLFLTQKIAKRRVERGLPLEWEVGDSDLVIEQRYFKTMVLKFKAYLSRKLKVYSQIPNKNRRKTYSISYSLKDKKDINKAVNGFFANYVHSYDAFVLQKFIINWYKVLDNKENYTIFTIHDRLNLPLNKVNLFFKIMNETLIEIFFDKSKGRLVILLQEWLEDLKEAKDVEAEELLKELEDLLKSSNLQEKVLSTSRIFF